MGSIILGISRDPNIPRVRINSENRETVCFKTSSFRCKPDFIMRTDVLSFENLEKRFLLCITVITITSSSASGAVHESCERGNR